MSISQDEVKKVAKLSRIKLEENEVVHFQKELSNIIAWVETLKEVDTDNIEPMVSVSEFNQPLREDVQNDGGIQEDILKNAPKSSYGCFVVPKVVE